MASTSLVLRASRAARPWAAVAPAALATARSNRPLSARFTAVCCASVWALLVSGRAAAQDGAASVSVSDSALSATAPHGADSDAPLPGENADSLPGLVRMALPMPGPSLVGLSAQAGYGLYPAVGSAPGATHQLAGQVGVGLTPLPFISARLHFRGDLNLAQSAYGEPELAVRAFAPVGAHLRLGGEIEARFVGADAPSIDFAATTPTFRALAAYQVTPVTWLAGQLGYRWDNSAHALSQIPLLADEERTVISASSFDALEFGLGASHRINKTEILGEVTADVLVGRGAPSFGNSPISLALGVRHEVLYNLSLRAHVEVSPSGRPDPYPQNVLISTRPRFAAGLGFTFRLGAEKPRKHAAEDAASEPTEEEKAKAAAAAAAAAQAAATTTTLSGSVVDEAGNAMPDVKVRLTRADGSSAETFTDASGHFVFEGEPYGDVQLHTESAGYDAAQRDLHLEAAESPALEVTIYESLPAGQVRGKVLDLSGKAVGATLLVQPGNQKIEVAADGSFSVDLKPGRYTLRFTQDGYRTQYRTVRVQDKGVVVLNIALEK